MPDVIAALRPEARSAPESGIVEVVNFAREREDLIALWVGEGDIPTPGFIRRAAEESLARGETFYTYQRGIPALREALAGYHLRHFGPGLGQRALFRHRIRDAGDPDRRPGGCRRRRRGRLSIARMAEFPPPRSV